MTGTEGVVFASWVADAALVPELERRLRVLARFYAPLGFTPSALRRDDRLGVVIGALSATQTEANPLVWGEPLSPQLAGAVRLIAAGPAEQRHLHGTTSAFALGQAAARVVNAPVGPTVLYHATSGDIAVWSTHAVAAGWLATGEAAIDESAIVELMAFDFVGGERTLLHGVRPVPPATSVLFDGGEPRVECWWPARERWQRLPEEEAQQAAEAALLETIDARLRGQPSISLGLTAGVDSRITALAVRELGLPLTAFTWGEPHWPDCVGATTVAAALGIEHKLIAPEWYGDLEAVQAHERAARFGDGIAPLAEAARSWPGESGPILGGVAAETGRAYYYEPWTAYLGVRSVRDLAASVGVRGRLQGASRDAVAHAERSLSGWVEEAVAITGLDFRALDILYTDQRVPRWCRSQVPPLGRSVFTGMTSVDFGRALVSLPLVDRLAGRFPERFVVARAPALAPVARALPPPPARAAIPLHRLNLVRHRRRPGRPADEVVDSAVRARWDARPETRGWIVDEALQNSLIADTMGRAWVDRVRAGFLEGRTRDTGLALRACGPVRLDGALRELRGGQSGRSSRHQRLSAA
ncbi:MAG: hypothetical protein ACXVRH_10605 [Thermoleophilaceae bacterium]